MEERRGSPVAATAQGGLAEVGRMESTFRRTKSSQAPSTLQVGSVSAVLPSTAAVVGEGAEESSYWGMGPEDWHLEPTTPVAGPQEPAS